MGGPSFAADGWCYQPDNAPETDTVLCSDGPTDDGLWLGRKMPPRSDITWIAFGVNGTVDFRGPPVCWQPIKRPRNGL